MLYVHLLSPNITTTPSVMAVFRFMWHVHINLTCLTRDEVWRNVSRQCCISTLCVRSNMHLTHNVTNNVWNPIARRILAILYIETYYSRLLCCADIQGAACPSEDHIQSQPGIAKAKTSIVADAWRKLGHRNSDCIAVDILARSISRTIAAFAADPGAEHRRQAKLVHNILMPVSFVFCYIIHTHAKTNTAANKRLAQRGNTIHKKSS